MIFPYILSFDHISSETYQNENVKFTHFDVSKFSVPRKSIDAYKNDLLVLNGLRMKIQLLEGQKSSYIELLDVIDRLLIGIDDELKK